MILTHETKAKLAALFEEHVQNRLAIWDAVDNHPGETKCDKCAYYVCPKLVANEQRIKRDVINLLKD